MKNPIKTFPGYLLRVTSQRFIAELSHKISDLGVRISDGTVLLVIQNNPGIRQSRIGTELNIARANMAPLVSKLAKKGLVRKKPLDGRSYGLYLTPEGEILTKQVLETMKAHERRITEAIPAEHRDSFVQALLDMNPDTR